ncbi:SemiSWEET transporter [Mucilaginibacter sp. FT3.2]|uniref:SemiSWEET transporter n=1 Tax=Mucilaginibacter sp. FT3.2 TaxID=2723090 RepID=UPI00161FD668|nr:MtN3 and saliva related transmembrane protein [Mucilaginibacter sp. FT3.2]
MSATTILGLLAACGTTVSFLPQAITTIYTKNTSGISLAMYVLFVIGTLLWLIDGLMIGSMPVIMANAITLVVASVILVF